MLNQQDVSVLKRRLRGKKGWFDGMDTVSIDPNQTDEQLLITLFHEFLHYFYKEASEDEVENKAVEMYSSTSEREKGWFLFYLLSL